MSRVDDDDDEQRMIVERSRGKEWRRRLGFVAAATTGCGGCVPRIERMEEKIRERMMAREEERRDRRQEKGVTRRGRRRRRSRAPRYPKQTQINKEKRRKEDG